VNKISDIVLALLADEPLSRETRREIALMHLRLLWLAGRVP